MHTSEICVHQDSDTKITIKNVKLRKDMCGYSLDITYIIDNKSEVQELHIPRVMLPISNSRIYVNADRNYYGSILYTCDLGFGSRRVLEDDNGVAFTIKTLETKTKEMTLEEIEKKLGHKVKIVNK